MKVENLDFASALKLLLDEIEDCRGGRTKYTELEMYRKGMTEVWFSDVNMETNEGVPHLMTQDTNNNTYFWTPSPVDILATDWGVRSQ